MGAITAILGTFTGDDYDAFIMNYKLLHLRDYVMPVSSFLLILPMCYSKTIDFLKYVSAFGVFIILHVVALIFVEYNEGEHTPGPIKTKPDSWLDISMVNPGYLF